MLPNYGMFFIFISGMAYLAAFLASVLISIKTMALDLTVFRILLLNHLFFAVGVYLSWDIIKSYNYNPKRIFELATQLSIHSLQFLLILHGIFLAFHFFQGKSIESATGLYEVVHFLTYLALFYHFRKKRVI